MYLICHVTWKDHVTEGSCDFMGRSYSLYITTLSNWVAIGIVVVEICFEFVMQYDKTTSLEDHVTYGH